MKKHAICIILVLLISILSIGMTFAIEHKGVEPQGMVAFSSGLTKEDSSYTAWANAMTTLPEDLLVGFTLYRVVNGSEHMLLREVKAYMELMQEQKNLCILLLGHISFILITVAIHNQTAM